MNTCCDLRDHIIDVDCEYQTGKYLLKRLPGCLPSVFTVRLEAPADYTAGDNIVVKDTELPVMTSRMEAAGTGIFRAGAILHCEIDLDRKLAFIITGGSAGSGEDVEFQTSDLVYYIDPLGDDSPNNPGGLDSPFKTLTGAGRAAWQNIVMNPLGTLTFSFNPGTYDLTEPERRFMVDATHPLGIIFKGTNIDDKPIIKADHFCSRNGNRTFQGLRLHATISSNGHVLSPYENAITVLQDSEVKISKSGIIVLDPHTGGTLRIIGSLKVDGDGNSVHSVLKSLGGTMRATSATISIENLPSVTGATVFCGNSHMQLDNTTFQGTVSGKRYHVYQNGTIETRGGGPNLIPGTIAGTTATGGLYT